MAEERVNRKLAAILASDVVGYSRLMRADEAGTLAALKRHRETVFDQAVVANNGRIVKLIGDGTIVEFGSVVDAVNCALSVQRSTADQSISQPRIVLRIGINLGDVIVEGDDIYGDGVNIAARMEPLAEPGEICISFIVHESIGNRMDVRFQDGGEISVKNIDRPIRIWSWHLGTAQRSIAANPTNVATASIAVLSFTNMSGDPEQEYFSDGISEDIITDLSKIAGLTVIARNSSFTYKGRAVDVRTVGRDLGVRSVLEGSIRTLSPAEKQRLADTETANIAAYDCVLRGRGFMLAKERTRETFAQAIKYFKEALQHDPNYSLAYACLGFGYMFDYQNRWTEDPDGSLPIAKEYARQAIEKDPKEPLAHCVTAWCASLEKDLDRAATEIDIALSLNPNLALAHSLRGTIRTYSGQPLEAIPEIEQAMRLDPAMNSQFIHFLGMAYLLAGKYETAAALLRQRIILMPKTDFSRALLTAVLGHLGEVEDARRVWAELIEINPNYSFTGHVDRQPFKRQEDVERIAEGLVKAGLLNEQIVSLAH